MMPFNVINSSMNCLVGEYIRHKLYSFKSFEKNIPLTLDCWLFRPIWNPAAWQTMECLKPVTTGCHDPNALQLLHILQPNHSTYNFVWCLVQMEAVRKFPTFIFPWDQVMTSKYAICFVTVQSKPVHSRSESRLRSFFRRLNVLHVLYIIVPIDIIVWSFDLHPRNYPNLRDSLMRLAEMSASGSQTPLMYSTYQSVILSMIVDYQVAIIFFIAYLLNLLYVTCIPVICFSLERRWFLHIYSNRVRRI